MHTPGPWEIDHTGKYYKPCIRHNGIIIALLAKNDAGLVMPENQQAEDEANARLIAAAPELLEALKAVLKDHDGRVAAYGTMESQPCRVEVMEQARVTIAKATGPAAEKEGQ
jgi:hypothetical protein